MALTDSEIDPVSHGFGLNVWVWTWFECLGGMDLCVHSDVL